MIYAIIGTEILSLIICLILLLGSIMENRGRSKRARCFIALVSSTLAGCLCDLLSWGLDGRPQWNAVLYFTTLCSMMMTLVMVGVFISYLSAYVSERKKISNVPAAAGWAAVAVGLTAVFIACVTGNLFTFQNGCFSEGPLYSLYVIFNSGLLISGILLIIRYRNALDVYDKVAGYAYILIPMASAMIGLLVEDWDFSYPAATVSLLILYIMLQSDRRKRLEHEGTVAGYQATHDELTGLYNRKAYRDRVSLMKSEEGNSGVIFGDVNGLKTANDTLGHEAGDRLLLRYAKILADTFRMNDVYRISGDEFICIMENTPEEAFDRRVSELESILNLEQPPLACVGKAYGSSKEIEILLKDAETGMYEKKKIVHERFPKTRR